MFVFQLCPIVLAAALLAADFPSLEAVSKPKVASGFSRTSRVLKPLLEYPTAPAPSEARGPAIVINDNRQPAGTLANGVLTLDLRAGVGLWRPEADAGPALSVEAFGEGSSPLSVPAPLIRVPEGTEIAARVRNELESPMRVHGLCERGGSACPPVEIPAGESRQVRFRTGPAGTYHYWATSTGMPLVFRAVGDTQLSGAFVVDPVGTTADAVR